MVGQAWSLRPSGTGLLVLMPSLYRTPPIGPPCACTCPLGGAPMAKKERIREALDGLPTLDYLMRRVD